MTDADGSRQQSRQDDAEAAAKAAADERRWSRDLQKFERSRLERVQASARVWLGVLTTLLGLLGSVVLLKGGDLVTGVTDSGPFQLILVVLVGLVFAVTVFALIYGGQATWGGLGNITQPPSPRDNKPGDVRPEWMRAWFGIANWLAMRPDRKDAERWDAEREEARREEAKGSSGKKDWQRYKDRSLISADRRRVYLHASRTAGVIAAALIAVLAIMAVIAGTVSPAPAEVIVIHHGRTNCVPASNHLKYTGVTQVIPVNSC
ncbi:MAG: hypothetical protein ACLQDY_04860 [Streptosporangiaceae bacterium]